MALPDKMLSARTSQKDATAKGLFITHGIPATATVVSAARTGVMINHVPHYNFHLNLKTSDGPRFEVSEKKTVDPMEAINLSPGSTLPAYMDPQKEEKIFINCAIKPKNL